MIRESDCLYTVVYTGRPLAGHDPAEMRRALSRRLKLSSAQAERLFAGGKVTVRRGLARQQAERYRLAFEQAGAHCELVRQRPKSNASESAGRAVTPLRTAQVDRLFASKAEPPEALALHGRAQLGFASAAMMLTAGLYLLLLVAIPALALVLLFGSINQFGRPGPLLPLLLSFLLGVVLATLSVAWLRPLLPRSAAEGVPAAMDSPLWYFVERVAAMIGAPPPQAIHLYARPLLNADLRIRDSWRRPTYAIGLGMPLILGLDSRQLGAALAHELSMLVPVKGWRRAGLIRSLHRWSMRPPLDRDPWVEQLMFWRARLPAAMRTPVDAAIHLLEAPFRLQNRFKQVLARTAAGSMRVLQARADEIAAQFIGSADFRAAAQALYRLHLGFAEAHAVARAGWLDRRLPADLPALTLRCLPDRPASPANDTAPLPGMAATVDRIRHIEARRQPGLMAQAIPARRLLTDAGECARDCTRAFYEAQQDLRQDDCTLLDAATCLDDSRRGQAAEVALKQYFLGLWNPRRFFVAANLGNALAMTSAQRAAALRKAISELREAAPFELRRMEHYESLHRELLDNVPACTLARLIPNADAEQRRQRLEEDVKRQRRAMSDVDTLCADRIALGLAQAIAGARQRAAVKAEIASLLAAQAQLAENQDQIRHLRETATGLEALLDATGSRRIPEHMLRTMRQRLAGHVQAVNGMLVRTPNPFSLGGGKGDLLDLLARRLPPYDPAEGHRQAQIYAVALADGLEDLHRRVMGRLAFLAISGERALRSPPQRTPRASA